MKRLCLLMMLALELLTGQLTAADWRTDYRAAFLLSQRNNRPILVECSCEDCVPCRRLKYAIDEAGSARGVIAVRLDGERNKSLLRRLRVERFPTVLIIKAGKVVERVEGYEDSIRLYRSFCK